MCLHFFTADVFDYTGAGPARQAIKNVGYEKSIPPVVQRAPVIVVNEPVAVVVAPPPIDPLEEIIARGLATLRAYAAVHPPEPVKFLDELATRPTYEHTHLPQHVKPLDEFARQARWAPLHHATGAPSPRRDRSSTAEYDDAVRKLRPGVALCPPPPKKMEGEPVEDDESKVELGRGVFAHLRRLFWGR